MFPYKYNNFINKYRKYIQIILAPMQGTNLSHTTSPYEVFQFNFLVYQSLRKSHYVKKSNRIVKIQRFEIMPYMKINWTSY